MICEQQVQYIGRFWSPSACQYKHMLWLFCWRTYCAGSQRYESACTTRCQSMTSGRLREMKLPQVWYRSEPGLMRLRSVWCSLFQCWVPCKCTHCTVNSHFNIFPKHDWPCKLNVHLKLLDWLINTLASWNVDNMAMIHWSQEVQIIKHAIID